MIKYKSEYKLISVIGWVNKDVRGCSWGIF